MDACNVAASMRTSRRSYDLIDFYYHPPMRERSAMAGSVLRPARLPGSGYPPLAAADGIAAVYAFNRGARWSRPALTVADVIDVAQRYYGVSRAAIVGTGRRTRRPTADALVPFRYVALILAMRLTRASAGAIADAIGKRDSTSVYMAYRYIKKRPADERWHEDLLLLTAILQDLFEVAPSGRLGSL